MTSSTLLACLETVVLRPPGVWSAETYEDIKVHRRADPAYEWHPFWEYGAFLDVRDLAAAIERALVADYPGDGTVRCSGRRPELLGGRIPRMGTADPPGRPHPRRGPIRRGSIPDPARQLSSERPTGVVTGALVETASRVSVSSTSPAMLFGPARALHA